MHDDPMMYHANIDLDQMGEMMHEMHSDHAAMADHRGDDAPVGTMNETMEAIPLRPTRPAKGRSF